MNKTNKEKFRTLYRAMLLAIFIGCFSSISNAQTDLNNYLKTAAENNAGLKSKFSAYNSSLEKIPQVGSLPDLSVSFGYFISPIETRVGPQQAKISAAQMLPWFGTLNSKKDVYIEQAKMKYEEFEETKSKLFYDVKSVYFDIYFIKKGIEITKENISILQTLQQLALIKVETGKASLVDEMRVEMEINELENQLAYLIDSKYVLEIEFHNLLNDSSDSEILMPDELWEEKIVKSKKEILDSILIQNHSLKQIESKVNGFANEEFAAKKVGSPSISIGFEYAFIGKSSNPAMGSESGRDAFMPMIGVSIPLYRKKYKSLAKEAVLNMEASQYEKTEKRNELTSMFEKGFRDFSDAKRRMELSKKQLKLAEKSLRILLTAYSSDGRNFEEVLRMERKSLKYALELDKARADRNAAAAFMNYLTGK